MAEEHTYQPDPDREVEIYDLFDVSTAAPGLEGRVVISPNMDELLDHIARDLCRHAVKIVQDHGDFHLALSGGRTPQPLYERLMICPDCRLFPWRRTHLWLVDERCVPLTHEDSNYPPIDETLVNHADIPRAQVHPIIATRESADTDYERQIREAFEWREDPAERRLDYVLLGMGSDGHTASLFPHTPALAEENRWVRFNASQDATPSERVTMTYPLINAARYVGIMVTGEHKSAIIQRVASGEDAIDELPILGVRPIDGELVWYLDKDACAGFEG